MNRTPKVWQKTFGVFFYVVYSFKFLRAWSPKKFSGSREAPAPSAPLNPSSECWKTGGSAAE